MDTFAKEQEALLNKAHKVIKDGQEKNIKDLYKKITIEVVEKLYDDLKTEKTKDQIIEEILNIHKPTKCLNKNLSKMNRKEVQELCKEKGVKNCRRKTEELIKDLEELSIKENKEKYPLKVEEYLPETDEEDEVA